MTYLFAKRSSLVSHYSWKCRALLHRINGPIAWDALHVMKGLYMELGLKIQELERMGHYEQAGTQQPRDNGPNRTSRTNH